VPVESESEVEDSVVGIWDPDASVVEPPDSEEVGMLVGSKNTKCRVLSHNLAAPFRKKTELCLSR
jgi:hypothetical protein